VFGAGVSRQTLPPLKHHFQKGFLVGYVALQANLKTDE